MFTITIISILGIGLLVRAINRFLPFRICPICAGVAGTWAGLLSAHFLGYRIDLIIPALLMGGSVVGISHQLDKKFKIILIPLGFIIAYSILSENWLALLVSLVVLLLLGVWFLSSSQKLNSGKKITKELERKMEKCC